VHCWWGVTANKERLQQDSDTLANITKKQQPAKAEGLSGLSKSKEIVSKIYSAMMEQETTRITDALYNKIGIPKRYSYFNAISLPTGGPLRKDVPLEYLSIERLATYAAILYRANPSSLHTHSLLRALAERPREFTNYLQELFRDPSRKIELEVMQKLGVAINTINKRAGKKLIPDNVLPPDPFFDYALTTLERTGFTHEKTSPADTEEVNAIWEGLNERREEFKRYLQNLKTPLANEKEDQQRQKTLEMAEKAWHRLNELYPQGSKTDTKSEQHTQNDSAKLDANFFHLSALSQTGKIRGMPFVIPNIPNIPNVVQLQLLAQQSPVSRS
jgi:hypothetical protein